MKFEELSIPGAWLIKPELVIDDRGVFRRHFCAREFASHGIVTAVAQGNVSENPHLYTLRGFHFQTPPHGEGKTISCIRGAVFDIIVDLRPDSATFLKWTSVTVSAENRESLHVPAGCANAYLTMQPDTIVHYYMTEFYEPGSYGGFNYRDPRFKFEWPATPRLISEKDKSLPNFDVDWIGR